MAKKKLNETQKAALIQAVALCEEGGFEVVGYGPSLVVMRQNAMKDKALEKNLEAKGLHKIDDEDDQYAGMITFSFFTKDQWRYFKDQNVIKTSRFGQIFLLLISFSFIALAGRVSLEPLREPWVFSLLGLVLFFALGLWLFVQSVRNMMWKLEFKNQHVEFRSLFSRFSFDLNEVMSVKLTKIKTDSDEVRGGKKIVVAFRNGKTHTIIYPEFGLQQALYDEIKFRVEEHKNKK